MKQSTKSALLLLLRECLSICVISWLMFCLVDYEDRGHLFWRHNLILAIVISPIVPLLRRCFLERNGGTRKAKYGE